MKEAAKDQVKVSSPKQKRAYQAPELVSYGTVAELTASTNANMGADFALSPAGKS